MSSIRNDRWRFRPTLEPLEARDVPSTDMTAAQSIATPMQASSGPLSDGDPLVPPSTSAELGRVRRAPDYNVRLAAEHIATRFDSEFNRKDNVWGIKDVRLSYYGVFERNGQQLLDVRVALTVKDRDFYDGVIFHMVFATKRMDSGATRFYIRGTEVWGRGQKTGAFFLLEASVHLMMGEFESRVGARNHAPNLYRGPMGKSADGVFVDLHQQRGSAASGAAASAVQIGFQHGTLSTPVLDAIFTDWRNNSHPLWFASPSSS